MERINKVVLAYSGGLDTSVILSWLKETYRCEVLAFCADIGQKEEFFELEERAKKSGADKFILRDLKEDFVKDYIFPMLRANATYERGYLLGTSIARPLIAKTQIEIAKKEGADAVCHGATGKGNDQVRFELSYTSLWPNVKIIAAWRDPNWHFRSRKEMIEYAKEKGIPIKVTKERPYSCDENIFHISYEGGVLEDPWKEPDDSMFKWTKSPEDAKDEPTIIEIEFLHGDPIKVNGEEMSPADLLRYLNDIGAENGIGRVDIVENRFVGIKSRGVYETPGGTIIHVARKALESITLDREVMRMIDQLSLKYAELVYYGFWFSPERILLQKIFDEAQKDVSGKVKLKLYKGNCIVLGRQSENSLYLKDFATFEEESVYDQKDATGFIRICGLRLKTESLLGRLWPRFFGEEG